MPNQDQLQPHNLDAEAAVIGALLIDPDAIIAVSPLLTKDDFFIGNHRWIYDAILTLHGQQKPIDLVTVQDELERRGQLDGVDGPPGLSKLTKNTYYSFNIEHHAGIVKRTARLRRLINAGVTITQMAYADDTEADAVLDKAERLIFEISADQSKRGARSIGQAMPGFMDLIDFRCEHQGDMIGVPTGLKDLDRLLGGMQKSDLLILAGRPGMGKTSLGINAALETALNGQSVAVFSLEMSEEQLLTRLVSADAEIDSQKIRQGKMNDDERMRFIASADLLSTFPIFIDDTPALSAMELRSKARRLDAEHGLDLVVVDYLQLMTIGGDVANKSENRQQEISKISGSLKQLARELNVPVLALSQLSRACESRGDKRPMLSDLRESGALEQDADVVIFIYRDEVYNLDTEFPNVAEIIVGKHRHGATGLFSVYFKKELTQFVDLEVRSEPLTYA